MATTYYYHIVTAGETLRSIAKNDDVLISHLQDKYPTVQNRVDRLMEMNNLVSETVVVGQTLKYNATSKATTKTATKAPATISGGMVSTDSNTAYVSWAWTKKISGKDYTDSFQVFWQYTYGATDKKKNIIWYDGHVETVSASTREAIWVITNSKYVGIQAKILPISQKKPPDKKGKQANYFTASWSKYISWSFTYTEIATPDAPDIVTYSNNQLTVGYEYVDSSWSMIKYEIVKNNTEVLDTITSVPYRNYSSITINVEDGQDYKVRACYTKDTISYSDWSKYTTNKGTKPSFVGDFIACEAKDKNSVYLKWYTVQTADTYTIQYATDPKYFDYTSGTSSINIDNQSEKETNEATISSLETGYYYYFRIRATNEAGSSGWSNYSRTILGVKPEAPTTWSLTTSVKAGDLVTLYWVHNSKDASREKKAKIRYTVGDVTTIIEVANTREDDDPETISTYSFDTSPYQNGGKIQWEVCTCGISGEYGDYSIVREIKVYTIPVVTMTTGLSSAMLTYPLKLTCNATQGVNKP